MQLQTASRKQVKIKMNIASPSGFGKTYSALLLGYGITGDWEKIAVIDTENDSASLYSNLGPFRKLGLMLHIAQIGTSRLLTLVKKLEWSSSSLIPSPTYGKEQVVFLNIRTL